MFGKKCGKCGKKTSRGYRFCPHCGDHVIGTGRDWGMLGEEDSTPVIDGALLPKGFNILFNSLVKSLNKEISSTQKKDKPRKQGVSISISISGGKNPDINMMSFGNAPRKVKTPAKKFIEFSKDKLEMFQRFKRDEPETNIRRLSNKVIYEITLPGIKSMDDVSLACLESSVEIKAVAKNKAYFKAISIDLPIIRYGLAGEKFVLEFDAR